MQCACQLGKQYDIMQCISDLRYTNGIAAASLSIHLRDCVVPTSGRSSPNSESNGRSNFRSSGCANADGFIFSSNEKQLTASLDSNIFVSLRLIAFAVKRLCKKDPGLRRQRNELFLACVMKDGGPGFPLVEVGPALRHVILVIQRQGYPGIVPVIGRLHSRYSFQGKRQTLVQIS
jgi:hypothetical protein